MLGFLDILPGSLLLAIPKAKGNMCVSVLKYFFQLSIPLVRGKIHDEINLSDENIWLLLSFPTSISQTLPGGVMITKIFAISDPGWWWASSYPLTVKPFV